MGASNGKRQVRIDKAMLTKGMQIPSAKQPPKVAYKVVGINGTDVFENCLLQFGKIPEVSGYVFVVDHENPNYILAAYAPNTWSQAVVVSAEEVAKLKGEWDASRFISGTQAETGDQPSKPLETKVPAEVEA